MDWPSNEDAAAELATLTKDGYKLRNSSLAPGATRSTLGRRNTRRIAARIDINRNEVVVD